MEKIYIPTTTLNFNNILATESISPKSFYEKRNFGYKRFEKIELNNFDNILIGYSKLLVFDINDEENDNYPLILEVSKDIIKDIEVIKEVDNIKIYKISSTIYLNPNKVKFLFLNDENKKITFIKAEPSISTKLLPLYKNNIEIYKSNNSFEWDKRYLSDIEDKVLNIEKKIEFDRDLNRIKGFYYCYILGDIYRKFISQDELQQELYNNITKRQEAIKNYDYQNIMEINHKEIEILQKNFNEKIDNFDSLNIIEKKLSSFINPKSKESAELYKNIINSIIEFEEINNKEEFKNHKIKLLKVIFDEFDNLIKPRDERHIYLKQLAEHIQNFKEFNIDNIKKDKYLLKSIVCFILKGDDLEKLFNFLKENNLIIFKIAFGLWGALFGFSAIPKTLSNILFEEKTKNMIDIQKFLKDMYKKIHNLDIQDDIKIEFIQKINLNEYQSNTQILSISNNVEQSFSCPKCGVKMIKKEVKKDVRFKGYEFFGCVNYPKCKGKRDLEGNELNDDFKVVNKVNKSSFIVNRLTEKEIREKIYKYIEEQGDKTFEGKKLSFAKIKKLLKSDINRRFENSDIREIIKNDNRFEVIEKRAPLLQIKGITK